MAFMYKKCDEQTEDFILLNEFNSMMIYLSVSRFLYLTKLKLRSKWGGYFSKRRRMKGHRQDFEVSRMLLIWLNKDPLIYVDSKKNSIYPNVY